MRRCFIPGILTALGLASTAAAGPVISEFLAANESILADESGAFHDWIEIHNAGEAPVDLKAYVLSDGDGEWAFPDSAPLAPDARLVVFASGREGRETSRDGAGHWHADFRLNRDGESLSLRSPEGALLSEFADFPRQRTDVSFGVASNGDRVFFEKPSPGESNGVVILGYVGDTKFSVDRGYHDKPFPLAITVDPSDATILYTTDGTTPDKGTLFTDPVGEVYEGPIEIARTTVLKALAFKKGWRSSDVDAQTYVFLADVLKQPLEAPDGYLEEWGGQPADYGMDEEIVQSPEYRDRFDAAFRVFPTLSIAMDLEDLFGRKGIYQNTTLDGPEWERATSVEFLFPEDESENFHVSCGIRIQGGSSRQTDIPKHSFSLRFREEYGLGELEYPMFAEAPYGESAVDRFDFLQLRAGFNFAWTHRHYYQARHAQYNRDQFVNDLYLAMGHPGVHGRWFHGFLNGLYWGMYHVHERPDANYMASYFGGAKEDYDAVNSGQASDGDLRSWDALWSAARNAEDDEGMAALEEHLNVDAFIDYMLLNFYVGNWDWDGHNWRAAGRHGTEQPGGWLFFPWDSEFAISPNGAGVINNPAPIENALTIDRTRVDGGANRPTGLHQTLLDNPHYERRFADRIQKHFHHGGVFTPERVAAIWKTRSDLMDMAIVAESARWGDYKRDLVPGRWAASDYALYTVNEHYLPNQKFLFERYFPERTAIVLEQLDSVRLSGNGNAPVFRVNGEDRFGGEVLPGTTLTLEGTGKLFYTLDGVTDPADPEALAYQSGEAVELRESVRVRARTRSIFEQWSPLSEAFFFVGVPASVGNLIVSEIHYHPAPSSAAERAAGYERRSHFEFIELRNVSEQRVNLMGVRFVDGVAFRFEEDWWLDPSEHVLVVQDPEAFAMRYPGVGDRVAGRYEGRLRNSGESLKISDRTGQLMVSVGYDDREPWPEETDGEGYSLVWTGDPAFAEQLPGEGGVPGRDGAAAFWGPSDQRGGSPGRADGEGSPDRGEVRYGAWLEGVFSSEELEDEALSGRWADGDGDGRPTLVEYVVGSSPKIYDGSPIVRLSLEDRGGGAGERRWRVSWSERRGVVDGSLVLETSDDLQSWRVLPPTVEAREEEFLDAERLRVSRPVDFPSGSRYLRAVIRLVEGAE